jgi:nucleoside phosphorylase
MLLVVVASHREWISCAHAMGISLRRLGRGGAIEAKPGLALLRTGVGWQPASEAAAQICSLRPDMLLHVGYAGALRPGLNAGDLVLVTGVSREIRRLDEAADASTADVLEPDPELTARLRGSLSELPMHLAEGQLLTVSSFVDRSEDKLRLAGEGTYLACDMEASLILAAAREIGARYVGLRVISDSSHHEMPPSLRSRGLGKVLSWATKPGDAALDTWHMLRGWNRASTGLEQVLPLAIEALCREDAEEPNG